MFIEPFIQHDLVTYHLQAIVLHVMQHTTNPARTKSCACYNEAEPVEKPYNKAISRFHFSSYIRPATTVQQQYFKTCNHKHIAEPYQGKWDLQAEPKPCWTKVRMYLHSSYHLNKQQMYVNLVSQRPEQATIKFTTTWPSSNNLHKSTCTSSKSCNTTEQVHKIINRLLQHFKENSESTFCLQYAIQTSKMNLHNINYINFI